MNRLVIGAIALTTLAACGQKSADEAAPAEPEVLASGLAIENMDKSIRPGDDFFMYMNGVWIEQAEIPADKAFHGGYYVLRDEAEEAVKGIIEEASTGDFAKGTDEQKVGDLYRSYMDMETRDSLGVTPLEDAYALIDAIEDYDDLAVFFGAAGKRGISMPVDVQQLVDWNDASKYSMIVTQGGLGLPDREYYFKEDAKSDEIRRAYVEHIEAMLGLAGLPGGADAAEAIMAFETRLAAENMTKEDVRKRAENYQVFARDDWADVMPQFNWEAWLTEFGANEVDSLVLYMSDYLRALDGIIVDTDLETWKTYLKWNVLNAYDTILSAELDAQNFDFYGRVLSGTEEQRELWRRGTNRVNAALGEVVGKVYVAKHFPPEAKERMEVLVGNLVKAYEKSIKELDWMGEETKAEALRTSSVQVRRRRSVTRTSGANTQLSPSLPTISTATWSGSTIAEYAASARTPGRTG